MFEVYQDRFGGDDAPIDKQGNCFQACVATILQMPLEEAFDCCSYPDDMWFDEFNKWLKQYGLGCIFVEHSMEKPIPHTEFIGLYMVQCQSETLYQGNHHVVVASDGEFLHDPHPLANGQLGDCRGIYIFVPLEPYKLVRNQCLTT